MNKSQNSLTFLTFNNQPCLPDSLIKLQILINFFFNKKLFYIISSPNFRLLILQVSRINLNQNTNLSPPSFTSANVAPRYGILPPVSQSVTAARHMACPNWKTSNEAFRERIMGWLYSWSESYTKVQSLYSTDPSLIGYQMWFLDDNYDITVVDLK